MIKFAKCRIISASHYTISWETNCQGRYWRVGKALWICLNFWVWDKVIPYSAIGLNSLIWTVHGRLPSLHRITVWEENTIYRTKKKEFFCTCTMSLNLCGVKLTEVGINTCFFSAFNAYKYCRKSTEEFPGHSNGDWKIECVRHKLTLTMCCLGCYWKVLSNNN